MAWGFGLLLVGLAALALPRPAGSEVYRLTAPDGSVRLTNAPTRPGYERVDGRTGSGPIATSAPTSEDLGIAMPRARYRHEIQTAAHRYDVPERLIRTIIHVESRFNPFALSPRGARGLMQLMPATASLLGVHNPYDPQENIDGGVRHLRRLMNRFRNELPLALAAYHAGEAAVVAARGIPPYAETTKYVADVLRLLRDPSDPGMANQKIRTEGDLNDEAAPPGGGSDGVLVLEGSIYRVRQPDGTTLYTNIPPAQRRLQLPGSR